MKKIPLLPRYFRWIGLVITFISFLISQYCTDLRFSIFALLSKQGSFRLIETDLQFTILLFGTTLGLLLIAFTRNRNEDEMISSIRLFSWSWSIIFSFIFFLLITLFVYDSDYIMVVYFPQFILLVFLVLFNLQLFKMNGRLVNEE